MLLKKPSAQQRTPVVSDPKFPTGRQTKNWMSSYSHFLKLLNFKVIVFFLKMILTKSAEVLCKSKSTEAHLKCCETANLKLFHLS